MVRSTVQHHCATYNIFIILLPYEKKNFRHMDMKQTVISLGVSSLSCYSI